MGFFFFFFFQAEDGIRDFHVTGVQTCALPIWPAVERLLVHVLERGQFVLGDRADLERGGHARLFTCPAGPPPTPFPAGPGPLPVRRADLRTCRRRSPGGFRRASLTCAGVRDGGGRIQFGHHVCPWRGPSAARRAPRLAQSERIRGPPAHHRKPPGCPAARRRDGVHQRGGRVRVAVVVLPGAAHPAGAGRRPAALAPCAAHPVRADRRRPGLRRGGG